MTVAARKIVKQALALPERERLKVADALLKSVPKETDALSQEEWDEAWKKELEKRLAEMESGEDPGVPLEVIWEDLRRLNDKR